MSSSFASMDTIPAGSQAPHLPEVLVGYSKVDKFSDQDEAEILAFLSSRPIQTIFMVGLIRDNGLSSPLNRGTFYAYRNQKQELDGFALFGPKTIIEARSESALEAFAELALANFHSHLIRGEKEQIERLVTYLTREGRTPSRVCHELLLEQRASVEGVESVPDLRPAVLADSDQVVAISAMMLFDETGVNPLEHDPLGFCQRSVRRIRQGRVWVLAKNNTIIFKADVISEAPESNFVEGVYVDAAERGRGHGFRCLTELSRRLLTRTASISLVVNQENKSAQALYNKVGYELCSDYRTAYFDLTKARS